MKINIIACNVCGEQFTPDRNYKSVQHNGESMDICGAACAVAFWNVLWFESGTITLTTTTANELKVVKR